ncbi:MAG: TOBE domain-containing protein [Haloferacaceae archaeon]
MDEAFAAGLALGEVTFEGDDAALLRAVAAEGSVSGAAERLGRSRARALRRLERLEEGIGPLVERRRGGADGGGSRLTDEGRALLARFDRLRAALAGTAAAAETVLPGTVVDADGELAAVTTAAGRIRALVVAADGDPAPAVDARVQVSVRADAVTLHDPADAPPGGATSARNRFAGRVTAVDRGESVVSVAVDVGADDPLRALVTRDSAGRLDLVPGRRVVASFKATATRATGT